MEIDSLGAIPFLPQNIILNPIHFLFGGLPLDFELVEPLNILVGPNGVGKTQFLTSLKIQLRALHHKLNDKKVVYLSTGRNSPLEYFRSASAGPNQIDASPASVGQQTWKHVWWQIEGSTGLFLRLKERPDLFLKIEARLQALYQRRLRLEWGQSGLQIGFLPTSGEGIYFANNEASGLIHLIPLLAALYDDNIGILIIDEPEISMHPQLQAFLLHEIEQFAGDPINEIKKIIIFATHSPTMLPLKKISDLTKLIFFTDKKISPIQISKNSSYLNSKKLNALIARMSENHKLAFFAKNVLLVEGPSDEVIIANISLQIRQPLLMSNTQIVPVGGKGEISSTIELFKTMGKTVFMMADLDALADNNQLINSFRTATQSEVNKRGLDNILKVDSDIRDRFESLADKIFELLSENILSHRYYVREAEPEKALLGKKRATLAALLTSPESRLLSHDDIFALRKRFDTLLEILAYSGCIILRRGTIEDYYISDVPMEINKSEAAAIETELISEMNNSDILIQYDDLVKAIKIAAPIKVIDENALLREQLGSLLGAAMQIVEYEMEDTELNARTNINFSSTSMLFTFSNVSTINEKKIKVGITSKLFKRDTFPFLITERENPNVIIEQVLPPLTI